MNKEQLKWLLDEIKKMLEDEENDSDGSVCASTVEECRDLILEALTK